MVSQEEEYKLNRLVAKALGYVYNLDSGYWCVVNGVDLEEVEYYYSWSPAIKVDDAVKALVKFCQMKNCGARIFIPSEGLYGCSILAPGGFYLEETDQELARAICLAIAKMDDKLNALSTRGETHASAT